MNMVKSKNKNEIAIGDVLKRNSTGTCYQVKNYFHLETAGRKIFYMRDSCSGFLVDSNVMLKFFESSYNELHCFKPEDIF
jgi:cbb3-type cytochrome oxidase cytochrome c subunit